MGYPTHETELVIFQFRHAASRHAGGTGPAVGDTVRAPSSSNDVDYSSSANPRCASARTTSITNGGGWHGPTAYHAGRAVHGRRRRSTGDPMMKLIRALASRHGGHRRRDGGVTKRAIHSTARTPFTLGGGEATPPTFNARDPRHRSVAAARAKRRIRRMANAWSARSSRYRGRQAPGGQGGGQPKAGSAADRPGLEAVVRIGRSFVHPAVLRAVWPNAAFAHARHDPQPRVAFGRDTRGSSCLT